MLASYDLRPGNGTCRPIQEEVDDRKTRETVPTFTWTDWVKVIPLYVPFDAA